MLIKKLNRMTGKVNEMEIEITPEQLRRFENGDLVQRVFPHLSAEEREFLISGLSIAEQKVIFG